MSEPRTVRAPRGTQLSCKNWLIEAAYRMLQNNLDPEVAEKPEDLVVYGGRGQAARSWEAFDAISSSLARMEPDETLLVQSGVARCFNPTQMPRADCQLQRPHWATQEHFDALAAKGLMMYGQMTAGSWIYIGTQGILQAPMKHSVRWPNRKAGLRQRQVRVDRRPGHGRRAAAGRQ